jgi:hypothetical protein
LCGFKLPTLLVDSFLDVVNVIPSNSTIIKQRKNYIDASFITVVIYKKAILALTSFKTCLLLFSQFLELVDFSPNHVNVMCNNFLQQMEIDALEQLISEDVKVEGQIMRDGSRTCLLVFRIVIGVVAGVVTRGDEVYQHSSARVIAGGVRAHLNARGPLLPSRRGKNYASPWRASLEYTNLALARVYGFLPEPMKN